MYNKLEQFLREAHPDTLVYLETEMLEQLITIDTIYKQLDHLSQIKNLENSFSRN